MDQITTAIVGLFIFFVVLIVVSIGGLVLLSANRQRQTQRTAPAVKNSSFANSISEENRAERRRQMRQNTTAPATPRAISDAKEDIPSVDMLLGLEPKSQTAVVPENIAASSASNTDIRQPTQVKMHQTAVGPVPVKLHTGGTSQATEVFSILRDERDGRLMVLIGDTAHRSLSDTPEAKQIFTQTMKELAGVILKPDEPTSAAQAPQRAAPTTPAPTPSGPLPGDLPDYSIGTASDVEIGRFGQPRIKKVDDTPMVNMAEAIEDYLQYKIQQTPRFQRRGIHIRPALSGGVNIEVDGRRYEFVDEITDPDARQFIQAAINEWQERH